MTVIQALRDFIQACPFLDTLLEDIHIDFTDDNITSYGISPTGESTVKEYVGGTKVKQYNASLYIRDFTADDIYRLENCEFLENFSTWIDQQNGVRNFPVISDSIEIDSISCSNGMLFDLDETGDKGTYQIQIHLIYTRRI